MMTAIIAGPGEVPEWPNGPVSKTGVPFGVPRVRIPPSPLLSMAPAVRHVQRRGLPAGSAQLDWFASASEDRQAVREDGTQFTARSSAIGPWSGMSRWLNRLFIVVFSVINSNSWLQFCVSSTTPR